MTPQPLPPPLPMPEALALLLAAAVALASLRLLVGVWRRPADARPRAWRVTSLLLLQAASAALLYFALQPPARPVPAGTLVVLTANAAAADSSVTGERVVALPEAGALRSATGQRVPDLGTALRMHPGTQRLHVVGAGLVARDREAVAGRALSFDPAPLPRGFVELWVPPRVESGAAFEVRGRVHGVDGAAVELLDPAGTRSDRRRVDEDGAFVVRGLARTAGLASFQLRLRDGHDGLVESAELPLRISDGVPRRLLVMAGGPNPELKYLQRWAVDAGLRLHTHIDVGGGVQIGDGPVAFTPGGLAAFDLLLLDERAWAMLGERRHQALGQAVRAGLGVLLQVTGPLSAGDRARLARLGFALATAPGPTRVRLADATPRIGTDTGSAADVPPPLTRQPLRIDARDGSPLLRDRDGKVLAAWRAEGLGRVAVWLPNDSFTWVLAGHGDRHARLWSDAAAVVARPAGGREPRLPQPAFNDARAVLCDVPAGAIVQAPDGSTSPLLVDPLAGHDDCAAYWPRVAGWHQVRDAAGELQWPFPVLPADALPGVRAQRLRMETQQLLRADAAGPVAATSAPGPRWPWWLAWLAASALLWWLERSRLGRR